MKAELELRLSENEEEKPSDTPKQEERGRGVGKNDLQSARDHRGTLVRPGEAFRVVPSGSATCPCPGPCLSEATDLYSLSQ